jgi:HEAT repeat protein
MLTLLNPKDFSSIGLSILQRFAASPTLSLRLISAQTISLLPSPSSLSDLISKFAVDQSPAVRCLAPSLLTSTKALWTSYSSLAKDPSPEVRVAVAHSLLPLCDSLSDDSAFILPILTPLLDDPIASVRTAAVPNLGPLIVHLGPIADASIVTRYCASLESADSFSAAFSFPGVALTLGRNRWKELEKAFENVRGAKDVRVRRCLAFGLIAFGPLLSPTRLCEIAADFLVDSEDVAIGVISNLYQIVRFVDLPERLGGCFGRKYRKWRVRLRVSEQLRYCAEDFERGILREAVKPLLRDEVAVVRMDAALSFACLFVESEMRFLGEMARSKCWRERQVAALIGVSLEDEMMEIAAEVLESLCVDPVINVRIAAGRAFGGREKRGSWYGIENLRIDPDPDVREYVC